MSSPKSVILTYTKSTKGTHVFANEEEALSIYLRKDDKFFEGELPLKLKVTFESYSLLN